MRLEYFDFSSGTSDGSPGDGSGNIIGFSSGRGLDVLCTLASQKYP